MNYTEAKIAMKEGKKVRQKHWKGILYVILQGESLMDETGTNVTLEYVDGEWEIYNEDC